MNTATSLGKLTLVESMLLGSSIGHLMRSEVGVREKAYYEELSSSINMKLLNTILLGKTNEILYLKINGCSLL